MVLTVKQCEILREASDQAWEHTPIQRLGATVVGVDTEAQVAEQTAQRILIHDLHRVNGQFLELGCLDLNDHTTMLKADDIPHRRERAAYHIKARLM